MALAIEVGKLPADDLCGARQPIGQEAFKRQSVIVRAVCLRGHGESLSRFASQSFRL
jgi:hypothetical protein